MNSNTISWKSIRNEFLENPDVKAAYDDLELEFKIARRVIALRKASGLTQREFAEKVGIKQPQLAVIESGKRLPKIETLTKIANRAGYTLEINFVPTTNHDSIPEVESL